MHLSINWNSFRASSLTEESTICYKRFFKDQLLYPVQHERYKMVKRRFLNLFPALCPPRSSVRVEPAELHRPPGLQRRRVGLCLAPCPPGLLRRAPPCRGWVLLLPLHPWLALWRLGGVRKEAFVCAIAPVCVWGHLGEVRGQEEKGRGRGAVVDRGRVGREWHISAGGGGGWRWRKTPLFLPGGGGNSEPGCHVGNCLHLHLASEWWCDAPFSTQGDRHSRGTWIWRSEVSDRDVQWIISQSFWVIWCHLASKMSQNNKTCPMIYPEHFLDGFYSLFICMK